MPVPPGGKDPPRAGVVLVLFVTAVLLTFWPLLLGHVVFERDTSLWVFPARWFVRQALLTGELPAWNPYQGLGFPLLADPQYGVFYPPHWLFLLVPDRLVAHAVCWLSLFHILWGGLGMALLASRLGACRMGGAVAAMAWTLSGHVVSAWAIGPLLLGQAWIPWVALGFLRLYRGEGRAPLVSAIWPLALSLLVGEPFMSALGLVFALVVVLAAGCGGKPTRVAGAFVTKAGAVFVVAVAVAGVSWLPPLRMIENTERAQPFRRDVAEAFSHHPLRLLEMALPGALADPTGEYPAGRWVGEASVAGAPLFSSSYLGIAVLGCALLALRRSRLLLVLGGFAAFALLVAFGKHAPVHDVWRRILFPFAHMHSPEKYVVLVVAPVALLAGLGASRVRQGDDRGPRRLLYFAGIVLGLWALARLVVPEVLVPDVRAAALRGLGFLGALLGVTLLFRRFPGPAAILLLALIPLDLGLRAHQVTGFGPAGPLLTPPLAATTILDDSANGLAPPRVYREAGVEEVADPLSAQATWQDSQERAVRALVPNTLNVFGIAVMPGYASAVPDVLARLQPVTYGDLALLLRLLAMRYVLASDPFSERLRATTSTVSIGKPLPHGSLLRVTNVLPRVYLPARVRSSPEETVALAVRNEAVASGNEAVVSTALDPLLGTLRSAPAVQACRLTGFALTRVEAFCESAGPNLAVFVEQFDQGWSARVDGRPAQLVRTNLVMRGVPVEAGEHRIELRYRTPGLGLAVAISIAGLLSLVAAFGLARITAGRGAR